MKLIKCLLSASILLLAGNASANTITYTVDNLVGNTWQYNYTVENTGAGALEAFTIFFDLGVYENLSLVSSPADWDSFVVDPDPGLPDDGIFDSFALVDPLLPGASLSGWSVMFDLLVGDTPGDQFFEFYDPFDFTVISDGFTTLAATPVPEPSTLALFAAGLLSLGVFRRRKSESRARATDSRARQ